MTVDVPVGNLLGLDFGDKTVGVSFRAKGTSVAVGVEIIRRRRPTKLRQTLARIDELCRKKNISALVLGLPLLLDGQEGERCVKTRDFGAQLEERTKLPVIFWDERLTSVAAEEAMTEGGLSLAEQKARVDELAAVLILQDFLNAGFGDT